MTSIRQGETPQELPSSGVLKKVFLPEQRDFAAAVVAEAAKEAPHKSFIAFRSNKGHVVLTPRQVYTQDTRGEIPIIPAMQRVELPVEEAEADSVAEKA